MLTYHNLLRKVCRMANVLKRHGVEKGDRVLLYLPMIPELPIAMLACARIGAIHSVVFGGFNAEALGNGIVDSEYSVLITADGGYRGGKLVPLKNMADEAAAGAGSSSKMIVVRHADCGVNMLDKRDHWWHEERKPGAHDLKPGAALRPFFGIEPTVVRDDGTEVVSDEGGYLLIKKPWPSLMRTIHGDHEKYKETYWSRFPGTYFTGDAARLDEEGDIWLLGRVDDVIKVSGHRIEAAELESVLGSHPGEGGCGGSHTSRCQRRSDSRLRYS